MDNVIAKYSEFFQDDGGLDKVKKDFEELGEFLIKEAKKIRGEISLFDVSEAEKIAEYEERTEDLTKAFKDYSDAREKVTKLEKDFQKERGKSTRANIQATKRLDELNVELEQQRVAMRILNAAEKEGTISTTKAAEARGRLKLETKALTQEINKEQKEIIDSTKLSRNQQKILEAEITLQKERAETITEIRERLSALRIVAAQVNITTQEGRDTVAAYNAEIDELTQELSENSDTFIQNKINVGNYEESIKSALESSDAFKTGIGGLDAALAGILGLLLLNEEALKEMEESLKKNNSAVKRFAVSFGKLNKVLKASIIGAVIIAIAALGSLFGDTVAGSVRLEKGLQTLGNVFRGLGTIARVVFNQIGNIFNTFGKNFQLFVDQFKGKSIKDILFGDTNVLTNTFAIFAKNFTEQKDNIVEGANEIAEAWDNIGEAIIKGLDNIDRAIKLEANIRRANIQLAEFNAQLARSESIASDSTISFRDQLRANRESLEIIEKIGDTEVSIARQTLEAINERVKQNVLNNGIEVDNLNLQQKGVGFAKSVQALSEQRGIQLEISKELIEEQNQAVIALTDAESARNVAALDNLKLRRELERDLFEQNLDLLIDVIDTEKNLSEQFVTDTRNSFQARLIEFERFSEKFKDNAAAQLEEFNILASKSASIITDRLNQLPVNSENAAEIARLREELQELENIDLRFEFDEDGSFQVFNGEAELSLDNIVALNKELQKLGLAEIPINRFREIVVETTNFVRDMRGINRELTQAGFLIDELSGNQIVDADELAQLEAVTKRILELGGQDLGSLNKEEADAVIKELEKLEAEKTEIERFAEQKRNDNRAEALQAELDLLRQRRELQQQQALADNDFDTFDALQDASEEELKLEAELAALKKKIFDQSAADRAAAIRNGTKDAIDEWKKFRDNLTAILTEVLKRVADNAEKQTEAAEENVDKQEEAVDVQQARAQEGLANTLAFEQRELAKREAELLKRQRREAQIAELQSIWNAYNANLKSLDENETSADAIIKTLRDLAVVKGITASLTSFGEGGVVEDKLPGNGIFRGRSHQGRQGGIPILVEGKEGILSTREMANLGKDNFYALKGMAGMGPIDSNFFTGQNASFGAMIPVAKDNDSRLVHEMREVKNAIKGRAEQSLSVPEVVDGILTFTETIKKGNKTKRNHYRIKKPKL